MNKRLSIIIGFVALLVVAACTPQATPASTASYTDINAAQLNEMLQAKDFTLINVHIPYEGELPQTDDFIPYNEIEANADRLPADKGAKIVVYCRSGSMSAVAARTLVDMGYTNVYNLTAGMKEWQAVGYELLDKSR
jgi:rhodanese-related sulfurtransferase